MKKQNGSFVAFRVSIEQKQMSWAPRETAGVSCSADDVPEATWDFPEGRVREGSGEGRRAGTARGKGGKLRKHKRYTTSKRGLYHTQDREEERHTWFLGRVGVGVPLQGGLVAKQEPVMRREFVYSREQGEGGAGAF